MGGGEASTGVGIGWSILVALDKEGYCISEDITSVVGEACEEGREGMKGVGSCWTGRIKECGSWRKGLDGVGRSLFEGIDRILQWCIVVRVACMGEDLWFWNRKADSTKTP